MIQDLCAFTCIYLISQGLNVLGLATVHPGLSTVFPDLSTVHLLLTMKWQIQKSFLIMTLHSEIFGLHDFAIFVTTF